MRGKKQSDTNKFSLDMRRLFPAILGVRSWSRRWDRRQRPQVIWNHQTKAGRYSQGLYNKVGIVSNKKVVCNVSPWGVYQQSKAKLFLGATIRKPGRKLLCYVFCNLASGFSLPLKLKLTKHGREVAYATALPGLYVLLTHPELNCCQIWDQKEILLHHPSSKPCGME